MTPWQSFDVLIVGRGHIGAQTAIPPADLRAYLAGGSV
jgi:hypothetical protein